MEQTVSQGAADANRGVVEEADQRSIEGGMLIAGALVAEIGHGGDMRRTPPLLAVA